jgi:hypothetical protein
MSNPSLDPTAVAVPKAYDLEACRQLMRGGSKSFFAGWIVL